MRAPPSQTSGTTCLHTQNAIEPRQDLLGTIPPPDRHPCSSDPRDHLPQLYLCKTRENRPWRRAPSNKTGSECLYVKQDTEPGQNGDVVGLESTNHRGPVILLQYPLPTEQAMRHNVSINCDNSGASHLDRVPLYGTLAAVPLAVVAGTSPVRPRLPFPDMPTHLYANTTRIL